MKRWRKSKAEQLGKKIPGLARCKAAKQPADQQAGEEMEPASAHVSRMQTLRANIRSFALTLLGVLVGFVLRLLFQAFVMGR